MPFSTVFGESSLNPFLGEDQPGGGVYLVRDSDYDLLGLLVQSVGSTQQLYAFYLQGDVGEVIPAALVGEDQSFYISAKDQDAFVLFPTGQELNAVTGGLLIQAGVGTRYYEGDLTDYPPAYLFQGGLFRIDGEEQTPAGRSTEVSFDGYNVQVYTAPDGNGTGVFAKVTDDEGHVLGGISRVNSDVIGDQSDPIVSTADLSFTVAWTQAKYDGANAEEYRAATFQLGSNIGLAVSGDVGSQTHAADKGDYVTDIFLYDTLAGQALGHDRILDFGSNDIFVTTTQIRDSNNDGIITFGRDKRLDLSDATGHSVGEVSFVGLRSLEFDGVVEGGDGQSYYVYSKVGSSADEHYLLT